MSPRRIAGAGRLVLLAALICAPPALALTLEEAQSQAKVVRFRVFGVLGSVQLQPADRALLEKDRVDLDKAIKGKDKALLEALIVRATANLDRVASLNLKAVKERYAADLALLEKLRPPALRPLLPVQGARIDKAIAEKGRILASRDASLVVGAQKSAEEIRVAATAEMRAALESLASGAARLARGNERVLAEKARGFKPAVEAVREAAGSKDLARMAAAAGGLLQILPGAKIAIEAALVQARAEWDAAEGEAKGLQARLGGDVALIDSGRRMGEAMSAGETALSEGQADALREAAGRLSALARKVPEEVDQKRTALLAERDAKVKGAEAQLGPGGGALNAPTRAALQSSAARAKEVPAGASLETLVGALGALDTALSAARAEASEAFKQALVLEGKARSCVTGVKAGLADLLAAGAMESLDRCLGEMKQQTDHGSAAGLEQAAKTCQDLCASVAAGACEGLQAETRVASGLAAEPALPADLKAALATGAGLLPSGAGRSDCRGIDRGRLARLRRDVTRAQIALALQSAYTAVAGGPGGLEKAIAALDGIAAPEDQKARSPLLLWSQAYFYYLKHRSADGEESHRWLEQARGTFRRAGSLARAELASSGLFPDDFVSAMAEGS